MNPEFSKIECLTGRDGLQLVTKMLFEEEKRLFAGAVAGEVAGGQGAQHARSLGEQGCIGVGI